MCDRRELERIREQRDDAIGRAVKAQDIARRVGGAWATTEEENRDLRAALIEACDELASVTALLADLTGE